jgi:exopolyphosphatase/guanosine-5'-triphosphate,3'-diphosphate pyrophosphatase
MDDSGGAGIKGRSDASGSRAGPPLYAAIDLGTNNCRLLIAAPSARGFRIVDAFSRIVRLGEGLSQTGRLGEAAMERATLALEICADKIARRGVSQVRAVATQACRAAANGADFMAEVTRRTGLSLDIITPQEEARLAVAGCIDLVDPNAEAALILDVGGGSTELSWLDLSGGQGEAPTAPRRAPIAAWCSIPIGVVTLAERFPEGRDSPAWRRDMVQAVKAQVQAFADADHLRPRFAGGHGHIVGTSGAITSLAGIHLNLTRYERRRVDGLWMTRAECDDAANRLAAMSLAERARQPCIGPDRADLVVAGAAILQAVQELWPSDRMRVADRGLREGLLYSLISQHRGGRRDHGRRGRRAPTRKTGAGPGSIVSS